MTQEDTRIVVIVTGTRHVPVAGGHVSLMRRILTQLTSGSTGPHLLIHGAHRYGVDRIADQWAPEWGYQRVPIPAEWTGPCQSTCRHGARRALPRSSETVCPAAGVYRNQSMIDRAVEYASLPNLGTPVRLVCAAFPAANRSSAGTADCMARAEAAGILVISTPLMIA